MVRYESQLHGWILDTGCGLEYKSTRLHPFRLRTFTLLNLASLWATHLLPGDRFHSGA